VDTTDLARILPTLAYCTHSICNLGVNDLSGTHAALRTGLTNLYTLLKANLGGDARTAQCTLTPFAVGSTNNYITQAAMTPGADESKRVLINADIRGSYFGALLDDFIEVADAIEPSRDSGIWREPTSPVHTGTATSATASTLTQTGAGWTSNAFKDFSIEITGGTGAGQTRRISAHSSQTITGLSSNWTVTPDATSTFKIWPVNTRDGTHGTSAPTSYAAGALPIRAYLEAATL
jgi:hypothetical protein